MKRIRILVVALVISLAAGPAYALARVKVGRVIKVAQSWKGDQCGYAQRQRLVVTTDQEWRTLWQRLNNRRLPPPSAPAIDFSKQMVIAVFRGECKSAGYAIEITKIREGEGQVVVQLAERQPPPDSMQATVLTQPYHIVVIKKTSLPIRFKLDPS